VPAQESVHLNFRCTQILNRQNKELQLHSDGRVGRFFRKYRDRCAGLFFSYSYPFDILTPAPQSGFARPSHATTAPLWLLNSLTWGQDNPEPNTVGRGVVEAER
jgi:hypothetical protein